MHKKNYDLICEILYRINIGSDIEIKLLEKVFDILLLNNSSKENDVQLGAILTGIMSKGPRKEEIIALLKSVFKLDNFKPEKRKKIKLPKGEILVGAVGSGKKGFKTINISTPSLITAASLGVYTAKSVSYSASSLTGSTDFLEKIGANLDISQDKMKKVILKTRFGAFKIERLIPKFNSIYGQKFLVPHALSFGLAALASPVKYDTFLYGLAHPNVELSRDVLESFGVKNVMVISTTEDGVHYLDEIGIYGDTSMIGIQNGVKGKLKIWNPVKKLKIPKYTHKDIEQGKTIKENIKMSLDVLKGKGDKAKEDIIAINSGTILYLAGKVKKLEEGYKLSKDALKRGLPYKKLLEFIKETGGDINKLRKFE
jgi:anthranilate phosphoribosyltransferase